MSGGEPLFSPWRVLRLYQYAWLEYYAHVQAQLVAGGAPVQKAHRWNDVWRFARRISARLFVRPRFDGPPVRIGPSGAPDATDFEHAAHEWLRVNYNDVYRQEAQTGSVLGMLAAALMNRGYDLNDLKDLDAADFESRLKGEKILPKGFEGLDEFLEDTGVKSSSAYAAYWNEREGGRWLAIYDEHGQRGGRAYEVVRDMVQEVVQQAIEEDVPIDQIRQRLLLADDSLVKAEFLRKDGSLDEAGYQSFMLTHLNRDMVRVAVTEAAINFNNGFLLQQVAEGGSYVQFTYG